MKQFAFISLLIIIGGLAVLFYSLKKPQPQPGCGVIEYVPFCGTANLSVEASEGKQIFNANCAACHKLDKKMTGPALRDMGKRNDTITIFKYLHGDKSLIESKGYNSIFVRFPQLTRKDIANIIKYTQ